MIPQSDKPTSETSAGKTAKVLVSACLMGRPVRYNGSAKPLTHPLLERLATEGRLVVVCPELSAGFSIPRPPAEISNQRDGDAVLAGAARVSKADGSQVHDLQRDALAHAGVEVGNVYEDAASGKKEDRPGLAACLKALRRGDTLVVWKLDRLGRDLRHLVNLVDDLTQRQIGLKVLAGEGTTIDTSTANGRLVFGIFAALAEFERALIIERTKAGLAAARARGRNGGAPFKMTPAKLRLAQAAMGKPETKVADLCAELGITRQTLYRFVGPKGELRSDGERLLNRKSALKAATSAEKNVVRTNA